MTLIVGSKTNILKMYQHTKNEVYRSKISKVKARTGQTDRQGHTTDGETDRHTHTTDVTERITTLHSRMATTFVRLVTTRL